MLAVIDEWPCRFKRKEIGAPSMNAKSDSGQACTGLKSRRWWFLAECFSMQACQTADLRHPDIRVVRVIKV